MTPRRALQAVPEASTKLVDFRFFSSFEALKTKFTSNFAEAPVQNYLFPSQKRI